MTDIKTIEAVADIIKAQGGEAFCSGFINAMNGRLYEKRNLIDYPDYLRGFISAADRRQLEDIASLWMPYKDFTGCPDDLIKSEIMKLVE